MSLTHGPEARPFAGGVALGVTGEALNVSAGQTMV